MTKENKKPTIWLSADQHFGHTNIIKYCNRPFLNIEEMDNTIINNINLVVKPGDIFYILGDFCFCKDQERRKYILGNYRERIKCGTVNLVIGNHDSHYKDYSPKPYLFKHFNKVATSMMTVIENPITGEKKQLYMHHTACRVWPNSCHGSYHAFAHSHGTLPDDPLSLSLDVGVDCWNYYPINVVQIFNKMKEKEENRKKLKLENLDVEHDS